MPTADALALVMALSQLPGKASFIMLTAKDAKDGRAMGDQRGGSDYLASPSSAEFIARVSGRLRRALLDC